MKRIATILMILIYSISMYATEKISFGPKAGLLISTMTNGGEMNPRISAQFGLFFSYKFNETLSLQPELLYSMQGVKEDDFGVEAKLNLDYLQIPLMLKLNLIKELYIELGPQIGFNTNSKLKGSTSGVEASIDIKEMINPVDVSFAVGVAYDFPIGVTANLRYNAGLTNVFKDVNNDENSKHMLFCIGIGWRF
ncbi:MAG: porin family protein [Bacteroidales bacterium]